MAVIGVKSITGITSITNAAGGADVLTFHSNNTTERLRISSVGELTSTAAQANVATFTSNQSASTIYVKDTDGDGILISGSSAYGHRIYTNTTEDLRLGANTTEKLRITSSYARVGINTSTFDGAGSQIKIEGRGAGTTTPPMLQIKGVGSGVLHAYVDLIATSDNNGGNAYRGLGVLMHDEPTNVEWFAGRPYAGSDAFIIGRKASPSYRTQSGESANQFLRISSGGSIGVSHNLSGTSNYNRLMLHNPHDGSCWIQMTSTASGSAANTDGLSIGLNSSNIAHIWQRENADLMFGTAGNERLRINNNGQLAGMGPDGGVPKIINDADVNLGGRYIWNRLQSSNYVTTSASNQFKIAFWRNTADGHVTCYYRGVSVRVYAGARTDWSGHGYVTHSSEVILTMSSTTNGRSHVVSNQGFSYLQNNSSNMRFTGTTWSYDSNYLYATFRFDTNESGTGWRPYYNVEVIDNDGIVQSVVGV